MSALAALTVACILAGSEAFSAPAPRSSFAPALARLGVERSVCVGAAATSKQHASRPPSMLTTSMLTRGEEKAERRLLGSRRLRDIKDVLNENPDQLDQSNKVLGSRRLGAIVSPAKTPGDAAPSPEGKSPEAESPEAKEDAAADPTQKKEEDAEEQNAAVVGAGGSTVGRAAPAMKADPPIAPAAVAPSIKVDMASLPDSVEKEIEMGATPEECYRVAADLAGYKEWAGGVEKVTVLETGADGLASSAEFSVGAFGQTLEYVLAYEHDVPRRVAWRATSGSVKALVGSYTFSDLGNGRTKVQYKLAIDPGFNVPRMIKTPATKLIVGTALNELRKQVEKPATKAAFRASKKM